MKRTILIIALAFLFTSANALFSQTMVSTEPQPRNAILEEFTGIHCGYCPDGHKRASDLAKANPGRVFLINIHAGGYAAPNAGEPDLRTEAGTLIDAAAGVAGYPAGSVNRSTTPWAKDRGQWATMATGIMSQTSPVNVAVKAYVDFTTRELVTDVEYYYTSASASATNYLTVVLTQDNILGYQSDYGNYNPTNWIDGKYRHNHALRMVLSADGAFGEKIETTTAGTFGTRTYRTTLPASIAGLDLVLYNLNVVAFVAEGKNNIYSGAGAEVEFDENLRADLGLTNLTVAPTGYCFDKIHPMVEVLNNSGQAVTTFDITCQINGTDYKKTFEGSLAKGEKTTIDWGEMAFSGKGNYSIKFIGFQNINGGQLVDMDMSNDSYDFSGIGFKQKAFSNFVAGFDGETLDDNVAFDQSQNIKFSLYTASTSYGANNTKSAVLFYLHSSWGISGKPAYIILGEAELSKINTPAISYYYAYSDGALGGTKPTVKLEVSEDCGTNWTELNSTTLTETGQPSNPQYLYIPKSSEYKMVTVNLGNYSDKDVLFRITAIPGTSGNAMFIDEVTVGTDPTGVQENMAGAFNMQVSPNPIEASSIFSYTINEMSNISINMVDVLGNTVRELAAGFVSQGDYKVNLNTQGLPSGTYYIIAYINNDMATIPVVISK